MEKGSKRILITGGSGFIGTNLVEHLKNSGHLLVIVDKNPPQNKDHTAYWKKGDLVDATILNEIVFSFSPTHVVHLAARTDLAGKQLSDYSSNTEGTANLMAALKQCPELQRVIFTSSMLVCRPGYIPANDLDFAPSTVYGQSKQEMELMIRRQTVPYDWCIIRPTSIWGPWFSTPYRDFFDRVMQKKMYKISNKASTKTYGFVLNSVQQIKKLLFCNDAVTGNVFYIGDAPPLNINNWADAIAGALGYKKPVALPLFILKMAAFAGDVMKLAGIRFPMTSFRLKNMTTNNILPLDNLYKITGPSAYSTEQAISITLEWLKQNK